MRRECLSLIKHYTKNIQTLLDIKKHFISLPHYNSIIDNLNSYYQILSTPKLSKNKRSEICKSAEAYLKKIGGKLYKFLKMYDKKYLYIDLSNLFYDICDKEKEGITSLNRHLFELLKVISSQ